MPAASGFACEPSEQLKREEEEEEEAEKQGSSAALAEDTEAPAAEAASADRADAAPATPGFAGEPPEQQHREEEEEEKEENQGSIVALAEVTEPAATDQAPASTGLVVAVAEAAPRRGVLGFRRAVRRMMAGAPEQVPLAAAEHTQEQERGP